MGFQWPASAEPPPCPSPPLTTPRHLAPPISATLTAGPSAFVGDLSNTTLIPPLELEGATLRLATSNEVYGLSLAGMSALHVRRGKRAKTAGAAERHSHGGMRTGRPSGWLVPPGVNTQPTPQSRAYSSLPPYFILIPFTRRPPLPRPLLQITLDPCTVLQPHTHPHSEFIFTIKGAPCLFGVKHTAWS